MADYNLTSDNENYTSLQTGLEYPDPWYLDILTKDRKGKDVAVTVKVDSAVKALQKLQDTTKWGAPRLEQALGKEGAQNLLDDLYAAQRTGVTALSRQQFALKMLKVLKWAGYFGIGGTAVGAAAAHYMP